MAMLKSARGPRAKRLGRWLGRLSPAHWSALAIVLSFVLGVVCLALAFVYGGTLLKVHGQGSVEALIAQAAEGYWAPLWVMLVFSVLAIAGIPQFLLIAATVAVFGPWLGGLYSWLATMGSAALGFVLGRFFGARMVRRYGGARLNLASALVARHGILSSALVRNVPSGPFIVLNVAAGATAMDAWKFLTGTGLGIIPKIVFIMLLRTGMMDILAHKRPGDLFWVGALIVLWLGIGYGIKRYWDRLRRKAGASPEG